MRSAEHSGRSDGFRVRVTLARSGRSDWVGGPRREGPKNPEEEGSVCELYLQCGADSAAGRALVDLLEQVPPTPLPTSPAPPRPAPHRPSPGLFQHRCTCTSGEASRQGAALSNARHPGRPTDEFI